MSSFLSSLFGYSDRPATTTSQVRSYIPDELKPYVLEILKDTQELYKQRMEEGYTPYTGDTIAGLTPEEIAAQEGLKSLIGTQSPFQQESLGLLRGGSEEFTADTAKKYMSPYMRAVIDSEKEQSQRQYESTKAPQFEKAAVDAGGMSGLGSRAGVQAAEMASGQQRLLADIESRGQQKAYQDAQQAFQDQKRRERTLAGDISTAGQNIFASGLAEQGLLQSIGEQKRDIAQTGLDEAYFKYLEEKQFPESQLARYQSSIYGNPLLRQQNYNKTGTETPAQFGRGKQNIALGLSALQTLAPGVGKGFGDIFGGFLKRSDGGKVMDPVVYQQDGTIAERIGAALEGTPLRGLSGLLKEEGQSNEVDVSGQTPDPLSIQGLERTASSLSEEALKNVYKSSTDRINKLRNQENPNTEQIQAALKVRNIPLLELSRRGVRFDPGRGDDSKAPEPESLAETLARQTAAVIKEEDQLTDATDEKSITVNPNKMKPAPRIAAEVLKNLGQKSPASVKAVPTLQPPPLPKPNKTPQLQEFQQPVPMPTVTQRQEAARQEAARQDYGDSGGDDTIAPDIIKKVAGPKVPSTPPKKSSEGEKIINKVAGPKVQNKPEEKGVTVNNLIKSIKNSKDFKAAPKAVQEELLKQFEHSKILARLKTIPEAEALKRMAAENEIARKYIDKIANKDMRGRGMKKFLAGLFKAPFKGPADAYGEMMADEVKRIDDILKMDDDLIIKEGEKYIKIVQDRYPEAIGTRLYNQLIAIRDAKLSGRQKAIQYKESLAKILFNQAKTREADAAARKSIGEAKFLEKYGVSPKDMLAFKMPTEDQVAMYENYLEMFKAGNKELYNTLDKGLKATDTSSMFGFEGDGIDDEKFRTYLALEIESLRQNNRGIKLDDAVKQVFEDMLKKLGLKK